MFNFTIIFSVLIHRHGCIQHWPTIYIMHSCGSTFVEYNRDHLQLIHIRMSQSISDNNSRLSLRIPTNVTIIADTFHMMQICQYVIQVIRKIWLGIDVNDWLSLVSSLRWIILLLLLLLSLLSSLRWLLFLLFCAILAQMHQKMPKIRQIAKIHQIDHEIEHVKMLLFHISVAHLNMAYLSTFETLVTHIRLSTVVALCPKVASNHQRFANFTQCIL